MRWPGSTPTPLPPASRAAHELAVAGIAMRRLRTKAARAALVRAEQAARRADIPALTAEVDSASLVMETTGGAADRGWRGAPAAARGGRSAAGVGALVVDACRNVVRDDRQMVSLATRPVLFALARTLGRSLAGRCVEEHAHRARLRRQARR